jgi:hypothetical protein
MDRIGCSGVALNNFVAAMLWLAAFPTSTALLRWLWRGGPQGQNARVSAAFGDAAFANRLSREGPLTAVVICGLAPSLFCFLALDGSLQRIGAALVVTFFGGYLLLWVPVALFGKPRWMIPPPYRGLDTPGMSFLRRRGWRE